MAPRRSGAGGGAVRRVPGSGESQPPGSRGGAGREASARPEMGEGCRVWGCVVAGWRSRETCGPGGRGGGVFLVPAHPRASPCAFPGETAEMGEGMLGNSNFFFFPGWRKTWHFSFVIGKAGFFAFGNDRVFS